MKPYECPRCEKTFSDKSVLNRHLKAHDKRAAERTFTCNTCGETQPRPFQRSCSAPLINNPPLPLTGNDPPLKTQTHLLPKNTRSPLILLLHQLHRKPQRSGLAGKKILFSFLRTLFLRRRKISPTRTVNTGPRSVPDLVAVTVYKTGIISACPRSVPLLSANN